MAVGPIGSVGPIRFGNEFEVDTRTYVLRRDGRPLKLERIPMEVLLLLIERAGQLVTREEIAERVWGKQVHLDTDNSINSAIRKIRLVLRDDPDQPRFVQTIVARGYVFLESALQETEALQQVPPKQFGSDLLEGRRIGDYRILHLLGGGGMGVVYKAEDLKLGRQVAIKFLPRELASDPASLQRMRHEAQVASALDHPHICPVYQFAECEGQPFIVMPLLEGRTLREWIAQEALRPATTCVREVLNLGIQIGDALQSAHDKGIIHRDIKPANIFLTTRGDIKILDFGVASIPNGHAGPAAVSRNADTHDIGGTGFSPGTPAYLSPEQVKGEKLDARSDLFSFGSILYEMTTGQRAFAGDSVAAIQKAILTTEPRPLCHWKPGIPDRLEQIVARTIEKDRDRRYRSAAELSDDLRALEAELTPRATATLTRKSVRPPKWKWYSLASLSLAVLVALAVLALRYSPGPQPFRDFTITQITNTGRAEQVAVSPDGKYVALVNDENGLKSMRFRNISTGSDTEILPPQATRFKSLAFSPDGNYLYFRQLVNGIGSEWDAFRIPVLGGKQERIARDVDSDIIFSPDQKHIAYVRANDPEEGKYRILQARLDGSDETVISIQTIGGFGHEGYPPFAAWSPDGKRIAYTFYKMADEPGILRVLDLASKQVSVLQHLPDRFTADIRWPRPNWLMLVNWPKAGDAPAQVGAFSLADRKLYPITRDTNSYSSLTVSADGTAAAAVQAKTAELLDLAPASAPNADVTRSNLQNVQSFDWDRDGDLVYSDGSTLWRVDPASGRRTQLTSDTSGNIAALAPCSSGYILVNWQYHAGDGGSAIWRLNADGSNPEKLSDGKYDMAPACSPDGHWAYYLDSMQVLKRVPLAGGAVETIPLNVQHLDRVMGTVSFSPDRGSLALMLDIVDPVSERAHPKLGVLDLRATGAGIRLIDPDPRIVAGSLSGGGVRFSPDGKSLVYAIKEKGIGDLWSQPLDGSPGHALTSYDSDLVAQFRYSPDAKTLAIKREHTTSDIVVLRSTN